MVRLFLLLTAIGVLLMGCGGNSPASTNTPEVMELQGVGDTWQGYQLFLRFSAPEATRDTLFADYEELPCDQVLPRLALPDPAADQFTPAWSPDSIAVPDCYTAKVSNAWTYSGTHVIVVDAATNQMNSKGIGG